MLVIFSCPAHANITMFGDVAVQLLKFMGHSGKVPGAIRADDVPAALTSLQAALNAESQFEEKDAVHDEESDEPGVSLTRRALPLIELLNAAIGEQCYVMWDSVS
ncbi:DUF1840 domain-containing protein [Alteromonas facilis]|uniref:DUF1840 domain-containing protein n=1 Tax=Alteromonas facilis TaxID=2048004 RepID=UPI000C290F66|nr:DUF1840 domain-containing protein [Alteromonas facilis]